MNDCQEIVENLASIWGGLNHINESLEKFALTESSRDKIAAALMSSRKKISDALKIISEDSESGVGVMVIDDEQYYGS